MTLVFILSLVLACVASLSLPAGLSPEQETLALSLTSGAVLLSALKMPARWRESALVFGLIFLFCALLIGRWHAGVTTGEIIAGRIPFNDQARYVADAAGLQDGSSLSAFSSRRPINVLMLGVFMAIGRGDFAIASALLPVFAALALASLCLSLQRSHGVLAAWFCGLLAVLFYRRFLGTGMSEHAGFIFGCLGAALLWRGCESRWRPALFGGLFLLTIALVARAGCFFVLPMIVLWIGWLLRRGRWPSGAALAFGVGAIIGGFALNGALLHLFGTPGASFGNFPYTLYGLISGGDWTRLAMDRPDLAALPEADAAPRIAALVIEQVRAQPSLLLNGVWRAWLAFFKVGSGQFAFLHHGWELQAKLTDWLGAGQAKPPSWPKSLASLVFDDLPWLLCLIGLATAALRARDPRHLLVLAVWIGILASIPFNPPWDSDSMRTYAATLPLQLLTVGLGAARGAGLVQPQSVRTANEPRWPLAFGVTIAASLMPALAIVWLTAPARPVAALVGEACSTGPARPAKVIDGAGIRLTEEREHFLDLPVAQFRAGQGEVLARYADRLAPFSTLEPGAILLPVRLLDAIGYRIVVTRRPAAARALAAAPQLICPAQGGLLATLAMEENATPR
jgi:hypothetical protein